MSKNIVVFSDATGQEGGKGHNTNVYKLFNMLEHRTSRQVAFYDRGLGTGWRKISGNVSGSGISHNIRECYRFIFDHFEADDRIFLFGFSRGAATVRSLSSFIHYFGILPKSRPELIKKAYKIYKKHKHEAADSAHRHHTMPKADDFVRRHHTLWTRIKFIGCFDTVAALGLPFKTASAILDNIPGFRHEFHDFFLSESIENAYHALAIDDERKTFHPILWDATVDEEYQNLRQVWFSGTHTDVGGGYEEQKLSDIPLVWMTQMAVDHGLRIYDKYDVSIKESADGAIHDSRGTTLTKMIFLKQIRSWDGRPDKPVVHQSVLDGLDGHKKHRKEYKPWILDFPRDVEPWVRYENQKWRSQREAQQANDPT